MKILKSKIFQNIFAFLLAKNSKYFEIIFAFGAKIQNFQNIFAFWKEISKFQNIFEIFEKPKFQNFKIILKYQKPLF